MLKATGSIFFSLSETIFLTFSMTLSIKKLKTPGSDVIYSRHQKILKPSFVSLNPSSQNLDVCETVARLNGAYDR